MSKLAFQAAKSRIDFFTDMVRFLRDRVNLCSHRNYENCLQSGIEAFIQIERAEENYLQAIADGRTTFDSDIDKTLVKLYESWLQAYALAEDWIVFCYTLSDYSKFRKCREEIQDRLEQCT